MKTADDKLLAIKTPQETPGGKAAGHPGLPAFPEWSTLQAHAEDRFNPAGNHSRPFPREPQNHRGTVPFLPGRRGGARSLSAAGPQRRAHRGTGPAQRFPVPAQGGPGLPGPGNSGRPPAAGSGGSGRPPLPRAPERPFLSTASRYFPSRTRNGGRSRFRHLPDGG